MRSALLILLGLPLAQAALTCTSPYGTNFAAWCDSNCNHVPPFCPTTACSCTDASAGATPTPTPTPMSAQSCVSVYGTSQFNEWCNINCNHQPPFCPATLCTCTASTPTTTAGSSNVVPYDQSNVCCIDEDAVAYFIDTGDVYALNLDANGDAEGTPTLCGDFVNAVDIELDNDGGLFVADHNAASVFYIAPGCGAKHLVYSWVDNMVPAPVTFSITSDGNLLVVVNPGNMYRVMLDSNIRYVSHEIVMNTDDLQDMVLHGNNAYVVSGDSIKIVDLTTGTMTDYFSNTLATRSPDIADLVVHDDCGVFFSIPDANQVWHCTDLTDGSTCSMYCTNAGIDTDTCVNLWNPWGVAVDCHCNLYVANKAGGLIVRYNYGSSPLTNEVILSSQFHPQDIEVYVPHGGNAGACQPSPSSSSSASRSASPSPSASRSASPSPSASRSASPSPSESPIPSASPSASPSPQWNFAMSIEDMNAVCVQGTCSDTDATIRSDIAAVAGSARVLGIYTEINYVVTDPLDPNCETVNIQTTPSIAIICTRTPTPAQVSNSAAALSDIILYIRVQTGTETFPTFSMNWQHLGPLTFPNAYLKRSGTMAIVDCTGHNNLEFIVAWGLTRLCWNDPVFSRELCHEGFTNTGTIDGGGTYLDASGNALDGFWPHKKFVCVETTP